MAPGGHLDSTHGFPSLQCCSALVVSFVLWSWAFVHYLLRKPDVRGRMSFLVVHLCTRNEPHQLCSCSQSASLQFAPEVCFSSLKSHTLHCVQSCSHVVSNPQLGHACLGLGWLPVSQNCSGRPCGFLPLVGAPSSSSNTRQNEN